MYIKNYELRYGDAKDFYSVKPASILDILQDISTKHSASKGFGMIKLNEIGLAWLLKGWKIKFMKPVTPHSSLEVHTTVRNIKAVTSDRVYNVYQDGELKAKGIAVWFTFDINKKKVCKIPREFEDLYMDDNFVDDFEPYANPRECVCDNDVEKIVVSARDIDTNNHLNNQKSAEILMNALPGDFVFNNMTVLYKKEALLGEHLALQSLKTENGYYTQLKNEEGEVCVIGVFENIV